MFIYLLEVVCVSGMKKILPQHIWGPNCPRADTGISSLGFCTRDERHVNRGSIELVLHNVIGSFAVRQLRKI